MTNAAVHAYEPNPLTPNVLYLTFIVPGGCNLDCPFCIVRQRREVGEEALPPEAFGQFVRRTAADTVVANVSLQGYEPLMPASRPYTQTILATARMLGLPTAFVTNGTFLGDAVDFLSTLAPDKIVVSLDAAEAAEHDRIRRSPGAFEKAVAGIGAALRALPSTIAVSSVLLPYGRARLAGMPALLRDLGIDDWIVDPVIRVGKESAGGHVAERRRLFSDLLALQDEADRAGVGLTVDDELQSLDIDRARRDRPALHRLHVRRLPDPSAIIRMAPDGRISIGRDILTRVTPDTPAWTPGIIETGSFIRSLRGEHNEVRARAGS